MSDEKQKAREDALVTWKALINAGWDGWHPLSQEQLQIVSAYGRQCRRDALEVLRVCINEYRLGGITTQALSYAALLLSELDREDAAQPQEGERR